MDEERDTSLAVNGWSMWGGWSIWEWVEHVGLGGACGDGWSMWGWGSSIVEME